VKDQKRSIRRFHVERLKKKRKNYWGYGKPKHQVKHLVFISFGKWENQLNQQRGVTEMDAKQIARVVKDPQSCSCRGCSGNYERRYFGRRSIKELSFLALAQSEVE